MNDLVVHNDTSWRSAHPASRRAARMFRFEAQDRRETRPLPLTERNRNRAHNHRQQHSHNQMINTARLRRKPSRDRKGALPRWSSCRSIASILLERSPKIAERDHESHCLGRAWIEAQRDVEPSCVLRDRVNNDAPDPDGIGCVNDALRRIAKQRSPQAAALVIAIHGQPRQNDDRDRIWHVPPESAWDAPQCNSA